MPKRTIGFYLMAMTFAVAIPLVAFVVILLAQFEASEERLLVRRTAWNAQELATNISQQLRDMSTKLQLLSTATELERGDFRAFHARTQAGLRAGSLFVILVDKSGQQLLNTRVTYDTRLGPTSHMASLKKALADKHIMVSDVFFGATSQRWVFNVIMPLPEPLSRRAAALIMTQDVSSLDTLMPAKSLYPGWAAALIDGSGRTVVSTGKNADKLKFPDGLLAKAPGSSGALEDDALAPGDLIGYARLPGWSWTAVLWGPVNAAQHSIEVIWRYLIIGGLALLAAAVTFSFLVARQLRNTIYILSDRARRMGQGEIVSPVDTPIIEANQMAEAMSEASFDRSEAEDRMRLVLRELAHRTKNMLSVIQAMIGQTARQSDSVEELQSTVEERLWGLARSIDLLIADDWSGVPMGRLLMSHLAPFVTDEAQLTLDGDDFLLRPDAVQNLGMALHELATNAVKYGALSVAAGRVRIKWREEKSKGGESRLVMNWTESGGPRVSPPARKGFGSTVIDGHLRAAFRATVKIRYASAGLEWTMKAPMELLELPARAKLSPVDEAIFSS